jgi:cyclase
LQLGWKVLKRRIIPIQLLLNGRLVKSKHFTDYRDVGDPVKSSAVYNSQYADELIFLNIARERESMEPLAELMQKVSRECFMPLSVGGGIRNIDDAAYLIHNGADKVVINSGAYLGKAMLSDLADRFGKQAIVVAIDVKRSAEGNFSVWSNSGQQFEPIELQAHMHDCEVAGAGEFLIQSIDQDGAMEGFDIDLLRFACRVSNLPIIGCGGSGNYNHLKEAFLSSDVSGLACGSLFNFSDSNPLRAKAFLSNYNIPFKVV